MSIPGTSLSAGGPGASSTLRACGVSQDLLFPQESRAFRSNQQSRHNQQIALSQSYVKMVGFIFDFRIFLTIISNPLFYCYSHVDKLK
jgi:hypothetical protein